MKHLALLFLIFGAALVPVSAAAQQKPSGLCPANFQGIGVGQLECLCNAGLISGPVWGTDIYSDDSSICAAAVHAGVIGFDGGVVTVYAEPGQTSYRGSSRFGISTSDWGNWGASFSFDAYAAAPEYPECAPTYQTVGADPYTCACYADMIGQGAVWGTDVYSDDSHICTAAVHAGVIPWEGGIITVWSLPGQKGYFGSSRFGISTSNWGAWERSFEVTTGGF